MRATVFHAPGDVRVENVLDPQIKQPIDAILFDSSNNIFLLKEYP